MEHQNPTSPYRSRPPKKPRDEHLRSCFEITPSLHDDSISIICRYCNEYSKNVKRFNPTVCRTHLVMHCHGVDEELRKLLMEGSQEFKRLRRMGEVDDDENEGRTAVVACGNAMDIRNGAGVQHHNDQSGTTHNKSRRIEMKEYTQLYVHQEKRTMERHWLDMWKDVSQEISRLRNEIRHETDVDVINELHSDIAALKRKKSEYARLLGM